MFNTRLWHNLAGILAAQTDAKKKIRKTTSVERSVATIVKKRTDAGHQSIF
jgi:hypothetical protein